MSIKTTFFNVGMKVGPAVSHTYVVSIRGFKQLAFLVSSCPVPTPARGSVSASFMGETYTLPTSVELSSGDWSVTLYENGLQEVLHAFYYAYAGSPPLDLGLPDVTGGVTATARPLRENLFDVDIYSFQGDYAFYVQTRLKNCWVKSFSAKGLDGSAASDVSACSLVLVYNGVELVESIANNPVANLIKYSALHLASKAASKAASVVDTSASLFGADLGLAAKAKEVDLTTSEIVSGAKLLNFVLGGGIL